MKKDAVILELLDRIEEISSNKCVRLGYKFLTIDSIRQAVAKKKKRETVVEALSNTNESIKGIAEASPRKEVSYAENLAVSQLAMSEELWKRKEPVELTYESITEVLLKSREELGLEGFTLSCDDSISFKGMYKVHECNQRYLGYPLTVKDLRDGHFDACAYAFHFHSNLIKTVLKKEVRIDTYAICNALKLVQSKLDIVSTMEMNTHNDEALEIVSNMITQIENYYEETEDEH